MGSKVYFARVKDGEGAEKTTEAAMKVFAAAGVGERIQHEEFVAVKFHPGDKSNTTHVDPSVIAALVGMIKERGGLPFLTETSTLYKGERENAIKHILHAHRHNFTIERTGAPFIMADGLAGDNEVEVEIPGIINKSVMVAKEARMADFLLIVSHMTGHIGAGFGAAIKNLGMGLASRKGKLRQHSMISPEVIESECVLCMKCADWCPADAIERNDHQAVINGEKCIGCGECLAVCRKGAIKFDFGKESDQMQREMAEHALGVVKDKKYFCINVCVNMTKDCDCFAINQEKIIPDIGVLGSWDPVALDQASLQLTADGNHQTLNEISYSHLDGSVQLVHAEKIGLGVREFELVEV